MIQYWVKSGKDLSGSGNQEWESKLATNWHQMWVSHFLWLIVYKIKKIVRGFLKTKNKFLEKVAYL